MRKKIAKWCAFGLPGVALLACAMQPNEEPPPKTGPKALPRSAGPARPGTQVRQAPVDLGSGEDLEALVSGLKVTPLPEGKVLNIAYAGGIRGEIEPCG